MLTTATTELIHSVLDGEASEAEAQQLQRLLAAEPAARAEFDAAERLFADFKSVPQRHPPEGLVAAVMAAAQVPAAKSRAAHQLSSRPRVIGSSTRDIAQLFDRFSYACPTQQLGPLADFFFRPKSLSDAPAPTLPPTAPTRRTARPRAVDLIL